MPPRFEAKIWRHCEDRYARCPQEYLKLQNEHGLNVNLLLLAEELDHLGHQLSPPQWQQLAASINDWEQQTLLPYRQLRKLTKPRLSQQEYQQMLDLELMMERKSQSILVHTLNGLVLASVVDATKTNLDCYLNLFGLEGRPG